MIENPFAVIERRLNRLEDLLVSIKQQPLASPLLETDQLLTIQQASEFLKLSVPTIYGLVSRSELPVNKRGKRLYFSKQELTDWVKAGRKKTQAEIKADASAYLLSKKKRG